MAEEEKRQPTATSDLSVTLEHRRIKKHYKINRNYRTIKSGRSRNYNINTGQITNRNYRKIGQ